MADIADTLKNLLGDNADEKISSVMNMLSENKPQKSEDNTLQSDLIAQAQGIMSNLSGISGDDRSNLLMSLKPFMRQSRKDSIDKAIKMLNFAQLSQLLGEGL
jgi:hypothetical protein